MMDVAIVTALMAAPWALSAILTYLVFGKGRR